MGYLCPACSRVSARTWATVVRRWGWSGGYDAAVGAHTSAASAARIAIPLAELVVGRRSGLASGLCTTIKAFRVAGWVASPTPASGISRAADDRAGTQHGETSTA